VMTNGVWVPLHHNAIHKISIPEMGRLTARSVQILHGGSRPWCGARRSASGKLNEAFE
jgi:hypothetical protein